MRRLRQPLCGFAIAALSCAIPLLAQSGAVNGEWRSYGGDEGSTRYSPLDQINRDNVKDLKIAWTWKSDNFGRAEFKNESTPIMANGILYFTAGDRRAVVAVDAGNGETLWVWRMDERRAPSAGAAKEFRPRRGVLGGRPGRTHRRHHSRIPHRRAERAEPASRSRVSARTASSTSSRSIEYTRGSDRKNRQHLAGRHCAQHDCRRPCPAGRRADQQGEREGRHHGLRRPHGPEKMGRSYDPAKGRGRLRNVAERLRRIHGQRRDVGAVLRRPGTRLCLSVD